MSRQISPRLLHNSPETVQAGFGRNDLTEQHGAGVRNDRDEIRAGLCVIVFRKPDRPATVIGAWVHGFALYRRRPPASNPA